MNPSKFIYLIFFILTCFLTAVACDGPEGPTGPQGLEGEQGPEGAQGPQGEEGTANVIYSEWLDIDWNRDDEATYKSMYIEEPRVLEDDFMASGTLLLYFKQETTDGVAIAPLPFANGTDYLYFAFADIPDEGLEGIVVVNTSTDSSDVSELEGIQIRYVLIPGGVPAKMGENFLNDYQAVLEYYGIPN